MKVKVSPQGGFTLDFHGEERASYQPSDLTAGVVLSWGKSMSVS